MMAMGLRVPLSLAWGVPVGCAALVGAAVLLERRTESGLLAHPEYLVNAPLSVGFAVVGAMVVSRRPGQGLGWLYLGSAVAMALTLFVYEYAYLGLSSEPGMVPGALLAGWVSSWVWAFGFAPLFTFGLLLYPDSRLPSRRWRWAAVVSAMAVGCLAVSAAFAPGPLLSHGVADNPVGLDGAGPLLELVGRAGNPLMLVGLVAGVAALATRWRRAPAGGVRRRQITLLMVLTAVVGLVLLTEPVLDGPSGGVVGFIVVVVLTLVPVAVGRAILRDRLYDIDIVLNRSLVYLGLTGCVIILYAALVWVLGRQLGSADATSIIATGVVAALVLPLRTGLQRLVDRAMYGDRGDPYRAVSRLTISLQHAAAPAESLSAVAEAIAASLRLPYVAVEAASGAQASTGQLDGIAPVDIPLEHQGQRVGRLLVTGRDHRPLSARDAALLADLARPAGAAVHAVGLADALRASRRELVQAREEERRRIRRDLHDGLGPTLAGVALGLDIAAGMVERDPDEARRLMHDLKGEATGAVDDVRRIVYDLRPPALDELGLVAALRQQADRVRLRQPDLDVHLVTPNELPQLSAASAVAAYRIALEALTNTARHAQARHCRIAIHADATWLTVEVTDDGIGIAHDAQPGVGLTAMRERATEIGGQCRIEPTPPTGTRITAQLPLEER